MTPQQYDRMNGLNTLGGCLWLLCAGVVFPTVLVLTHSFLLGIGAAGVLVVLGTLGINKMKADV